MNYILRLVKAINVKLFLTYITYI